MIENSLVETTQKCYLCKNEISNSLWSRTKSLVVNTYINCIVCENLVCQNCYTNEEIFYPEKNKIGYCCKSEECKAKTRANLKVPFVDLNPVYNIIETQIPDLAKEINNNLKDLVNATSNEHLPKMFEDLNKNITKNLEEIKSVFEEQKSKAKNDAKELIEFTVNEKLPKILDETNKVIGSKFDELQKLFEEQKNNTKKDINEIIDLTVKNHLKPILLYTAVLIPTLILVISTIVSVEVIFLVKYLK